MTVPSQKGDEKEESVISGELGLFEVQVMSQVELENCREWVKNKEALKNNSDCSSEYTLKKWFWGLVPHLMVVRAEFWLCVWA